jgi:hypothetical protein
MLALRDGRIYRRSGARDHPEQARQIRVKSTAHFGKPKFRF